MVSLYSPDTSCLCCFWIHNHVFMELADATIIPFTEITFWQTIGLLILSRLLLGGFKGHRRHDHGHCRRHMHEKWENMTPEQREQFREHLHSHRPNLDKIVSAKKMK